jgi:hypothetical protein
MPLARGQGERSKFQVHFFVNSGLINICGKMQLKNR